LVDDFALISHLPPAAILLPEVLVSEAAAPKELDDKSLLALFSSAPERAWQLFLDRYSGFLLKELRRDAVGYDAAMDVFVHVCERLAADSFRRLRQIPTLGAAGELKPWLRQVARNAQIDLRVGRDGRKRLLSFVATLPALDQRIFQLTFWQGLRPSEVLEQLRREAYEVSPFELFEKLEQHFAALSEKMLWHLLARQKRSGESSTDLGVDRLASAERDPLEETLRREAEARLTARLAHLPARRRLIVRLRYDDALSLEEIATIVGSSSRTVRRELAEALASLRSELVR
jgi:RNA polymerase sigma factor (sigma-70 family)